MVAKVRGKFKKSTLTFKTDKEDPKNLKHWSFGGTLAVDSVDTGNAKRDKHLKADDFFDEANHKQIVFKSKSFKLVSGELGGCVYNSIFLLRQ